jgi:glucans biosynthesis protein C
MVRTHSVRGFERRACRTIRKFMRRALDNRCRAGSHSKTVSGFISRVEQWKIALFTSVCRNEMSSTEVQGIAQPRSALAGRLEFVDNVRWVMIVLVVTMHVAVTYSQVGSWYYRDTAKPDPVSLLLFVFYQTHLQAFFMGLLFMVAGYFVPPSFERKGARRFIVDRAFRLGLPALLYMLLIHPVIGFYILHERAGEPVSAVQAYGGYIVSGRFLSGSGPLWFAVALLFFCVVYVLKRRLWPQARSRMSPVGRLPARSNALVIVILLTAATFLMRLVQPIGTSVLNMQLCFFPQYVLLFSMGIWARHGDWLTSWSQEFGRFWLRCAVAAGPLIWLAIMFLGGATSGDFSRYLGGMHWQAAAYAGWESFFCISFSIGMLVMFRERFSSQGPVARFLSENAFAVYVLHPPIIILLSLGIRDVTAAPLLKFAAVSVIGVPACYVAAWLARRVPLLRRIL